MIRERSQKVSIGTSTFALKESLSPALQVRRTLLGTATQDKLRSECAKAPRQESTRELSSEELAEAAYEAFRLAFSRADPEVQELVKEGRSAFLQTYAARYEKNEAIPWLKFHSTCFAALALKQEELPVAPDSLRVPDESLKAARGCGKDVHGVREDDGCFCTGAIQTACKRVVKRARGGSRGAFKVALDILYFKKGAPAALKAQVEAAILKHRKMVTEPREKVPISKGTKLIIRQICKTAFTGQVLRYGDYCPSFNASYSSSRKDGGAFGELTSDFLKYRVGARLGGDILKEAGIPVSEPANPASLSSRSIETQDEAAARARSVVFGLAFESMVMNVNTSELLQMDECEGKIVETRVPASDLSVGEFQDWIDSVVKSRLSTPLDVAAVGIREPFKVRIISKGMAAEYYRCLDYQKFMHRCLKRFPVFEFIGHPITDENWEAAFGWYATLSREERVGLRMVSGDYEAATDNLNPKVSRYVWKQICKFSCRPDGSRLLDVQGSPQPGFLKERSWEYQLGRKALTGHRLNWREPKISAEGKRVGWEERSALQTWGQFMGSPMSFPVLCIANAAVCLEAMLENGDNLSVPLRVNGDDCAFACTDVQYADWNRYTSAIGLKKSVGKNYISGEFCVMNSEVRKVVGGHWEYQGYINQALLKGTVSKGTESGQKAKLSFLDVGPNLEAALRAVDGPVREKLIDRGIDEHRHILDQAPKSVSWWAPQELGGLGLPCGSVEDSVKSRPFELEARVVASYVLSSPKIWGDRPMPKTEKNALNLAIAKARSWTKGRIQHRQSRSDTLARFGWSETETVLPRQKHAQLGGREMLQFLLAMPCRLDEFGDSEGQVDNRKLADQWKKWIAPGLDVARAYKQAVERRQSKLQRVEDGKADLVSLFPVLFEEPQLVIHPLNFANAHVEYERIQLIGTDAMHPSRYDRSGYTDLGLIFAPRRVLASLPRLVD